MEEKLETRLKIAVPILSGLLASGHFTKPTEDNYDKRSVVTYDHGEKWQDNKVWAKRHTCVAIDLALELADEIILAIELDLTANQSRPVARPE